MSYLYLPIKALYRVEIEIPEQLQEYLRSEDEELRIIAEKQIEDDGLRTQFQHLRIMPEDVRSYHPWPDDQGNFDRLTKIMDAQGREWIVHIPAPELDRKLEEIKRQELLTNFLFIKTN